MGVRGLDGASRCSARIERAAYPSSAALQHMRVNYGRTDGLSGYEQRLLRKGWEQVSETRPYTPVGFGAVAGSVCSSLAHQCDGNL